MTVQGGPFTRLERALAGGDPLIVRMAAAECPRLLLGDALRVVLVHASEEPARYSRLAARWVGKLARERPVDLEVLAALTVVLVALPDDPACGRLHVEREAARVGLADVAAAARWTSRRDARDGA